MYVMRPGESSSLRVITSQCFMIALFKTHRAGSLGTRVRAALRVLRAAGTHASAPGPAAEPAVQVANTAASRRQRIRSLLKVRNGCEACLDALAPLRDCPRNSSWLRKLTDVLAVS